MSCSLSEFHFGPYMNLIIGPNGSGKSTFVCAVCIGLGGKLAYLGKETMKEDLFIKMGEQTGYVELELKALESSTNETIVIKRVLNRGASSSWNIDGEPMSEREVKIVLKKYNIHLDNLCQFLPQDRVSKFAHLKGEDLLREIERCYSDGEILRLHEEISKAYAEVTAKTADLELKEKSLNELQEQSQRFKAAAEKERQYLDLQRKIEQCNSVKPYFELQALMEKKRETKAVVESLEKEVENFVQDFRPFYDELNKVSNESNTNVAEKNRIKKESEQLKEFESKLNTEIKTITENVSNNIDKIESFSHEHLKLSDKIRSYKQEINAKEKSYNSIQSLPNDEFERIESEMATLTESKSSLSSTKLEKSDETAELKRNIQKYKDELARVQKKAQSTDRLDILENLRLKKYDSVIKAAKVLRSSAEKLQYFEPPILTIKVEQNASYAFDNIVSQNIQTAMIAINNEAYSQLANVLFNVNKIRIPIRTLSSNVGIGIPNPKVPRETIKSLGFDGYLVDYIQGPKEVIQMLCENANVHQIPISFKDFSPSEVDRFQNWNAKNGNVIVKFITGDSAFTSNKSRFGSKQTSITGSAIARKPNSYSGGMSEEQKRQIDSSIKQLQTKGESYTKRLEIITGDLFSINVEIKKIDTQIESLRKLVYTERDKRKHKDKIKLFIDDLNLKVDRSQEELDKLSDPEMKRRRETEVLSAIDRLEKSKLDKIKQLAECHMNTIRLKIQKDEWEMKNKKQILKSELMNNISIYLQETKKSIKDKLDQMRLIASQADEKHAKFKEEYRKSIEVYSAEEKQSMKQYITELREKFSNLDTDDARGQSARIEQAVNNEIQKMESEVSLLSNNASSNASERLLRIRSDINVLDIEIPNIKEEIDKTSEELTSLVRQWKPQLESIIDIVNKDFSKNMATVASGGSVTLDQSNPDYSKWKLVIKVSFRDAEELAELSGSRHSGGEKSTTTAVFLNSLQGLTNTAFRIVDEINQGMDAKNERNAHRLIVEKASDPTINASQYFLITPKLLTDFYYSPRMTVHCIFAGKWTPEFKDNDDFLKMGVSQNYVC